MLWQHSLVKDYQKKFVYPIVPPEQAIRIQAGCNCNNNVIVFIFICQAIKYLVNMNFDCTGRTNCNQCIYCLLDIKKKKNWVTYNALEFSAEVSSSLPFTLAWMCERWYVCSLTQIGAKESNPTICVRI